jgi:hypothetical protein
MDLKTGLTKLETLLGLMNDRGTPSQERQDLIVAKYAQVEDLIHQFEGVQNIPVLTGFGQERITYKDWVAAGWISGRTMYTEQGRTQLIKVISKVRSRLEDPGVVEIPASIDQLLRVLRRFRECCQYIEAPPGNEKAVQDIIWIMLRAQFERLDREDMLPRFGVKAYKPDFGVPDLRTLIEVKYVGSKTDVARVQEEILADVPGYLGSNSNYAGLVVLVYDAAHKLRDVRKFIEDLTTVNGVVDVIVVPGIGPMPAVE